MEKIDDVLAVMFPASEDLLLIESTNPLHTSGLQKAWADLAEIATAEIIVENSLSNPKVVQSLNELGQRVTRVNKSTKQIIRQIILRGVKDGEPLVNIRDNIKEAGINEYYQGRAFTIARTETRAAYDSGSLLGLQEAGIDKFDVVGCIGTLGVANSLGLVASYGDFSETIGSCGVLGVDMKLWGPVSDIHHPNHGGLMVSSEKL